MTEIDIEKENKVLLRNTKNYLYQLSNVVWRRQEIDP
jgi:hypothetical protein